MSGQPSKIDQFLEAVEIRVEAFGVCEIGRHYSLRCEPFKPVIVHFVLSGQGFMECRHGRFPLKPGTAVVVPKMLAKKLSGTGPVERISDANADCTLQDELLTFRACDGEPDLVLGCAELSSSVGGDLPLFDQAKRPIIEHSDDPLMKALFTTMFEELRNPRLGTRAFVSALMKQVLIVLLRSQPNKDSSILLMTGARLAGVVAAILDRPQDNHTVDSLAAIAGMSRSRFSHHFTLAYDVSPKAFVQTARLASAARMLKGSDLPVKSIAASVGYVSRSHFSRAFQAKFGVHPSAFRVQAPAEPY
ncbi:AraC family transcriptional regulator [Sphingomonas sp.]|jgi:AraC-like DNA-binding protein|uniref:helix-turn-helix domain-containing protein n=1 Tax=Sphingomonas sp. TaxID=28214 RepID=UPI00181BEA61|nr:AraC family transcriptional regulator [Sphingomonas sp.]MBA3510796.1 helix-turn-helix transcriptional regulator [Sphingomonas sp.]